MSSSDGMRQVITHSAALLRQALDIEAKRSYPDIRVTAAMAYANGVMDLLSVYLVVTDTVDPIDREGVTTHDRPDP